MNNNIMSMLPLLMMGMNGGKDGNNNMADMLKMFSAMSGGGSPLGGGMPFGGQQGGSPDMSTLMGLMSMMQGQNNNPQPPPQQQAAPNYGINKQMPSEMLKQMLPPEAISILEYMMRKNSPA